MSHDLWYDLGIGLPAFRALMKGVKSGFKSLKSSYEEDVKRFGDEEDYYPYFDRLMSNVDKIDNMTLLMVVSCLILFMFFVYCIFTLISILYETLIFISARRCNPRLP